MNYHIAYQWYDDAQFASFHSIEDLKAFMEKKELLPEDIWLVEGGNMVSGQDNKHMPKEYFNNSKSNSNFVFEFEDTDL